MAPKKTKIQTAAAPKTHPGPIRRLDGLPAEVLKNIAGRLNYPTLQILRSSCKTFRQIYSEQEIHEVFMDLRLDTFSVDDEEDEEWKPVCRTCMKFCDDGTPGAEHSTAPKVLCKACNERVYLAVVRPGALVWLSMCCADYYLCGHEQGETSGAPLGICKICYGLTGNQRSGKAKRRAFCQKFGAWLRLQWLSSAGRDMEKMDDGRSMAVFEM